MKVSVETPCRLHLTLIDLNGGLGRIDGGVGLALERPRVVVEASSSRRLMVDAGERSGELKALCGRLAEEYALDGRFSIKVSEQIPPHSGLGSTTQLYLATAKAIAELSGLKVGLPELAYQTCRGGTSGVGVAAFERGGFIVDSGHSFGVGKDKKSFLPSSYCRSKAPPVACRLNFPAWNVLLCIPKGRGLHGVDELNYFKSHFPAKEREAERICRIILMKLVPAVAEEDIDGFDESIKLLNKARGFEFPQKTREIVEEVNQMGGKGTSMTSFGPAVFTFADSQETLKRLQHRLKRRGVVVATKAANHGVVVKKTKQGLKR